DAALRRAARVALATTDAPGPVAVVPFLDRRFQPQLDQPEHAPVRDATSHRFHKLVVRDRVEVAGQIGVDHVGVAPAYQPAHFLDCVHRTASGAVAGDIVLEVGLEDRFQHKLGGSLHTPTPDGWNAEWSLAATGFWDHHPPHRVRPVRLQDQFLAQA